jgi:hypothetical protein
MVVEVENMGAAVCFIDPESFCLITLTSTNDTLDFSVSYMHRAFQLYAKKKHILTAYLSRNHWIAVAIIPKQQKVYYLDSFKSIKTDTTLFKQIISE